MSDPTPEALAFSEVHIEAFRRLTDVHLTGLKHLNLVVGDNNVGKTSVLEAVWLLAAGWSQETLRAIQDARAPSPHVRENLDESAFSLTRISGRLGAMKISGTGPTGRYGHVSGTMERKVKASFEVNISSADSPVHGSAERGWFGIVVPEQSPLAALGKSIPVHWVGISAHRDETAQAQMLSEATRNHAKQRLVELIRLLEPDIEALSLIANRKNELHVILEKPGLALALPHFGDAVRRLLFLAMSITSIPNGILLVDEAEASIHWSRFPRIAEALLDLLHEFNVQAFFTTHSLELIDAFVDATPDRDDVALYRLMRAPEDDRTIVANLREKHVRTLRKMLGEEVR